MKDDRLYLIDMYETAARIPFLLAQLAPAVTPIIEEAKRRKEAK